jgi:hypothetical protein
MPLCIAPIAQRGKDKPMAEFRGFQNDAFQRDAFQTTYVASPALFSDTDTFYSPIVLPGPVTIYPPLFVNANKFWIKPRQINLRAGRDGRQ